MSGFTSELFDDEQIQHDTTPEEWHSVPEDQSAGLDLSDRPNEDDYGYGAVADPFPPQLLIPRSEWQARIEEMEATQTRLSDLAKLYGLPCKNQAKNELLLVQWPAALPGACQASTESTNGYSFSSIRRLPNQRVQESGRMGESGPSVHSKQRNRSSVRLASECN